MNVRDIRLPSRRTLVRSTTGLVAIGTVLMCLYLAGDLIADWWKCHQKWGRSGYGVDFGPWSGCQIEMAKGRWVPAEAIRDIPIVVAPK